jgi:hypothetical protein
MNHELVDPDLNPLPPFVTFGALGDWLVFFAGEGVNLYRYIFDPEGDWGWGREALVEQGHSDAEIGMILQTGEDDFHEASAMLADLIRCEAVLCRGKKDVSAQARMLKELRAMMEGCKVAVGKGVQVQILALETDERDEMDDEDDEE